MILQKDVELLALVYLRDGEAHSFSDKLLFLRGEPFEGDKYV
jgi:hypothetical protein